VIYALLFRCSVETLIEIGADHKHLGAEIGFLPSSITNAGTERMWLPRWLRYGPME
jgi:hypothetical protein